MDAGLHLVVKNEENRIRDCLAPIRDLFPEIVVIDTGSTDATREILQDEFDIEVLTGKLDPLRCWTVTDQRRRACALLGTPWIMTIDADEIIDRAAMKQMLAQPEEDDVSGYFCAWNTHLENGTTVQDYKLNLFRRGFGHGGLVHDSVQPSFRAVGATAVWTDALTIEHYPEPAKVEKKYRRYELRLLRAIGLEPWWARYYWFLGYRRFIEGRLDEAAELLDRMTTWDSLQFPVECLYGSMYMAAVHCERGAPERALAALQHARSFWTRVEDDFEVRVNFRMKDWLDSSIAELEDGSRQRLDPHRFAY